MKNGFSEAFDGMILQISQWLPKICAALVIVAIFWLLGKAGRRMVERLAERAAARDPVFGLLGSTTEAIFFIFGLVTALGTVGIDVSALVAGLGLAGFAVGFALKDSISNVVAGIMLLIYRPFREQDYIKVAGVEGKVVRISLRYTRLELAEEGMTALVPNANIVVNPLIIKNPN